MGFALFFNYFSSFFEDFLYVFKTNKVRLFKIKK